MNSSPMYSYVITLYYIFNIFLAAQISALLLPQDQPSVCQGGSLSFVCRSDGDVILLYSPPIIDRSQAFSLTSSCESNPSFCTSRTSLSTTTIVVDDANNSSYSLVGTLNLYIPLDFERGFYRVFCGASSQGTTFVNSSTYRVIGKDPIHCCMA